MKLSPKEKVDDFRFSHPFGSNINYSIQMAPNRIPLFWTILEELQKCAMGQIRTRPSFVRRSKITWDGRMDGRRDGRRDLRSDGRSDEWRQPMLEMHSRIQKTLVDYRKFIYVI